MTYEMLKRFAKFLKVKWNVTSGAIRVAEPPDFTDEYITLDWDIRPDDVREFARLQTVDVKRETNELLSERPRTTDSTGEYKMTILIIRESTHFVILAPPRTDTKETELLEDMEFILAHGYRPLSMLRFGSTPQDAILCEKLTSTIVDLPSGAPSAALRHRRG